MMFFHRCTLWKYIYGKEMTQNTRDTFDLVVTSHRHRVHHYPNAASRIDQFSVCSVH